MSVLAEGRDRETGEDHTVWFRHDLSMFPMRPCARSLLPSVHVWDSDGAFKRWALVGND